MFSYNTPSQRYRLVGEVTLPGDKSISHRAIMFGSQAKGVTQITNFTISDDLLTTIDVFKSLGAKINFEPFSKDLIIKGTNHQFLPIDKPLNVRNVGELQGLLYGFLASIDNPYTVTGGAFLENRLRDDVLDPLQKMGLKVNYVGQSKLPVEITGTDSLKGIDYTQDISNAQVKSSLVLSGIYGNSPTRIHRKYVTRNHTENLANYFGADIKTTPDLITINPLKQNLQGKDIFIPGDFSSAAIYIVCAILSKDSEIKVKNICLNSTRTGLLTVLESMNGTYELENLSVDKVEPYGDLIVKSQKLSGTVIPGKILPLIIDELPLIVLMASQADGDTVIEDISDAMVQIHERLKVMKEELEKLNIKIKNDGDKVIIKGNQKITLKGILDSHYDHRIAMMLIVAANLIDQSLQIKNIEVIDVSYPNLLNDIKKIIV
ncbi:3-phosphoshikimate 1-carboxyvinyltransferase [Companilactobacillus metriopterae]|uniref:3-phosphoshikimate 1-carboxyvinyltransferase n=1 Tax=Companilactobacillus metriopterae TaxID=1909267 RepID=UPI0013E91B32|nr:3-phosphoshikimate 1-carboxyvinyltransferase [Companilactobacillus metriopterae]